ncbi:hypothetical protein [Methylovorus sp. MM2]|uniref:hypothetical protein n=1 Tax=Methylovorus sp. MM2 TaxID=1848038 RepID=UPI0009EE3003|nr:hypothetical protein [Methylovorus sp. MM2]
MMNFTKPFMILLLIGMLIVSFFLGFSATTHAEELEDAPKNPNPPVYIVDINPVRDVGYHVGDVLNRTVTLKVEKPYKLLQTSLPLTGTEKKYRGKDQGVEVRSAVLEVSDDSKFNIYKLELSYQVFTSSVVTKPSQLPPELVKFGGNGRVFQVRIPSWPFRISPLAVYGAVKIERDMSQFRGPLLLDAKNNQYTLWALLTLLALSLIGLVYILGSRTWLPRMGGPFAKAYRDLRKKKASDSSVKESITRLHHAFNVTNNGSVFTADSFIVAHPKFAPIKNEIAQFFVLSRWAFFDTESNHGITGDPQTWLRKFSRRCRDCERGLA